MKTLICNIGLLSMLLLIFSDISAEFPATGKNMEISSTVTASPVNYITVQGFEDWITDLENFIHAGMDYSYSEIQIEEWMTREFSSSMNSAEIIEQELPIEDWMTKSFHFASPSESFECEPEIEPWMCRIFK